MWRRLLRQVIAKVFRMATTGVFLFRMIDASIK
jgi:hypothetical protein